MLEAVYSSNASFIYNQKYTRSTFCTPPMHMISTPVITKRQPLSFKTVSQVFKIKLNCAYKTEKQDKLMGYQILNFRHVTIKTGVVCSSILRKRLNSSLLFNIKLTVQTSVFNRNYPSDLRKVN